MGVLVEMGDLGGNRVSGRNEDAGEKMGVSGEIGDPGGKGVSGPSAAVPAVPRCRA